MPNLDQGAVGINQTPAAMYAESSLALLPIPMRHGSIARYFGTFQTSE
jgi:hypothetical protein